MAHRPMKSDRRVLLLTEETGVGGVQTVLRWLESGLVERGWQVTRLSVRHGRPPWWACWRAARQAQVLVASNNFWPAYWAVALGRLARRPSVVWVHGPVVDVLQQAGATRLKTGFLHGMYRLAHQWVCASHTSCDSLLQWMGHRAQQPSMARIRVIRNPAVVPAGTPSGRALAAGTVGSAARDEVIALGFVGRLSSEKQPLNLLAMLRCLPTVYQLHVVGDGELLEAMHTQGQALIEQGRLHLHGRQAVNAQTYQNWQATVLCSRYEGYPMTALESMACGVPCVSTPIAAMQEMLGVQPDLAAVCLAESDSPAALARAVLRCVAQDPAELQAAMACWLQQHGLDTFVQQWDLLLSDLLASGEAP